MNNWSQFQIEEFELSQEIERKLSISFKDYLIDELLKESLKKKLDNLDYDLGSFLDTQIQYKQNQIENLINSYIDKDQRFQNTYNCKNSSKTNIIFRTLARVLSWIESIH